MNPAPIPQRTPDTLLILLALALLFAVLLPFLPAGHFEPGQPLSLATYRPAGEPMPLTLFSSERDTPGVLNLFFDGFTSGSRDGAAIGIIAFLVVVGGAFGVVQASGAVDRGIRRLVSALGGRPRLLLATLFVAFSPRG